MHDFWPIYLPKIAEYKSKALNTPQTFKISNDKKETSTDKIWEAPAIVRQSKLKQNEPPHYRVRSGRRNSNKTHSSPDRKKRVP